MNRFVSNLILGFFALVLMAVYGFAKQPTVYSMMTRNGGAKSTTVQTDETRRVVLPNGITIAAKLATTDAMRQQGLSGIEKLDNNSGMLFVFAQPGTYSMWMKDMKMPIDMIWLDDSGKVVHLATNVPVPKDSGDLPTYVNTQPAKYVLELTAGEADQAGIKEGVQLTLS